jgi:hypothetical protein
LRWEYDSVVKDARQFPLWLKIASTLFVAALIPAYWRYYGPTNFLWFSDIALFGMVVALWLEHRLLASVMLIAVLLPETAWNVDFLLGLILGESPLGLAGYMFEADRALHIRGLSLFHIPMPIILAWMVYKLGYDRRALVVQSLVAWVVLPVTYWLTTPDDNINWVYGPDEAQDQIHPWVWLGGLMLAFPLVLYIPTHALVTWLMKKLDRQVVGRLSPFGRSETVCPIAFNRDTSG